MQRVEQTHIKPKDRWIYDRININWYLKIGHIFNMPFFHLLVKFLKWERSRHTIYPEPKDVLKAFYLTRPDKVKVVIIGQEPYHNGEADGLAFSSKNRLTPSLNRIFEAIEESTKDLKLNSISSFLKGCDTYSKDNSLEYLVNQGVLLLNVVLTVREKQTKSHSINNIRIITKEKVKEGWEHFMSLVLQELDKDYNDLIFVAWGSDARVLVENNIHNNYIITAEHPVSGVYKNREWEYNDCFNKVNEKLKEYNKQEIIW